MGGLLCKEEVKDKWSVGVEDRTITFTQSGSTTLSLAYR